MTAEAMTALQGCNRSYTNPPAGQPLRCSQIEGMAIFTTALTLAAETMKQQAFGQYGPNLTKLIERGA